MDADDYLIIPSAYTLHQGEPRWSAGYEAIEFGGSTLAVVEQIGQVLEGVFSRFPAIPHFAHVLQLLNCFLHGPGGEAVGSVWRLREAHRQAKGAGVSRNLGVLIAHLCRTIPSVAAPPTGRAVQVALKRRLLFPEPDNGRCERPALGPQAFADRINTVLSDFSTEVLIHWLRHGTAPSSAGRQLAETLREPARPVGWAAKLLHRPRLVGAAALVPALDAAMTLPTRRFRHDSLPQGGYAGVATRGDPERLLPTQFALDSFDFVRRFAESELLYFRREEPHVGEKPLRLFILDQGVRTWGNTRLALAAAVAVAMGKDPRRAGALYLAATSREAEPLQVATAELNELASILEASDLTPQPAPALSRALAAIMGGPRDIVLLTHPRLVQESAVLAAARDRSATDRFFALTVNDVGQAELLEWRGAGIVRLRSFRVQFAEAAEPKPPAQELKSPGIVGPWTGFVEPIWFPFRPGVIAAPKGMTFDAEGEQLLIVGESGLLQVSHRDGSAPEVLPRALISGEVLKSVHAVLGVSGGFVVCGLMSLADEATFSGTLDHRLKLLQTAPLKRVVTLVAVHYDMIRRTVVVHRVGDWIGGDATWLAYPDLHSIVTIRSSGSCAIDLATGEKYPSEGSSTSARAKEALDRAQISRQSPGDIAILADNATPPAHQRWIKLLSGIVAVGGMMPPWPVFIPQRNGRKFLDDAQILDARLVDQTLAIKVKWPSASGEYVLMFLGPTGRMLGEYKGRPTAAFALSPTGDRFARRTGRKSICIEATNGIGTLQRMNSAQTHNNPSVFVGTDRLFIRVGKHSHAFTYEKGSFRHLANAGEESRSLKRILPAQSLPAIAIYDAQRFRASMSRDGGPAIVDAWGQVALLDRAGNPAAYFMIRREQAAVVLPDGTRWGSPALLGEPATPGAAAAIGRALSNLQEGE